MNTYIPPLIDRHKKFAEIYLRCLRNGDVIRIQDGKLQMIGDAVLFTPKRHRDATEISTYSFNESRWLS